MKGFKIALIAILAGVAIGLCAGMFMVLNGDISFFGWFGNSDKVWDNPEDFFAGGYTLQKEQTLGDLDITELVVDYEKGMSDVIFLPSKDGKTKIEEYFNKKMKEDEFARIIREGNTLTISRKGKNNSNFNIFGNSPWGYVKIYLPADVYAGLEQLTIKTSSGDITLPAWEGAESSMKKALLSSNSGDMEVKGLYADTIQISRSSGSLDAAGLYGQEITISANSGDLNAENLEAGKITISASSGTVELDSLKGETIEVNTNSGDISIKSAQGNVTLHSSSGYQDMEYITGNVNMTSNSGDQEIHNLEGDLTMTSSSGELTAETVKGVLKLDSQSGDQEIRALTGSGSFCASSGTVTIGMDVMNGDMQIKTTSGNVSLTVPHETGFHFRANTNSGDIETWFDDVVSYNKKGNSAEGNIGEDTGYKVTIECSSGDVEVR